MTRQRTEFQALEPRAFVPRYQRWGTRVLTGFVIGAIGACLLTTARDFSRYFDTARPLPGWLGAYGATMLYAAACAVGQVAWGTALALSVRVLRDGLLRTWPRVTRCLVSALVGVYCLQPFVVVDIWTRVLRLSPSSWSALVIASVWQYAPFVMVFVLAALDTVDQEEDWLTGLESRRVWAQFRHVYWPAISNVLVALLALRFLWMYSKFDLPFVFQEGQLSERWLLAVRVGKATTEAPFWAGVMVFGILPALVLLFALRWTFPSGLIFASGRPPATLAEEPGVAAVPDRSRIGTLLQPAERGRQWIAVALALAVVFATLLPLARGIAAYWPGKNLASVASLWVPLRNTIVIGGAAAFLAAAISGWLAYVSARGLNKVGKIWEHAPLAVYAVPLVLLSVYAKDLSRMMADVMAWSGLASLAPRAILKAGAATVICLSYLLFSLPFTFQLLARFVGVPGQLAREQMALLDGARPGIRFQARVVVPTSRAALLYAAYFAFVINWQDMSFALRVEDLSLFSRELYKLGSGEQMGAQGFLLVGLLASGLLAGVHYYLLSHDVDSIQRGRERAHR